MENYYITDFKDRKLYVKGHLGINIPEIITEVVAYFEDAEKEYCDEDHNEHLNKIVIEDLNGVDVEIDKSMSAEDAILQWRTKSQERSRKQEEARKTYEDSPEGRAESRAKAKHDLQLYKSVEEAILALTNIVPCDLKSDKLDKKEAMDFCKRVMTVLSKCERLQFNEEDQKGLSDMLKALGCASFQKVNPTLIPSCDKSESYYIHEAGSLVFPVEAFSQLIDVEDLEDFQISMGKISQEGRAADWVKAQEEIERE